MLGILIGIAAIVTLVSLGQGIKKDIEGQLNQFNPRTVYIIPSNFGSGGGDMFSSGMVLKGVLYSKDADKIATVPGVESVANTIARQYTTVTYKGETLQTEVDGVPANIFRQVTNVEIAKGRFLVGGERGVAVIGSNIANKHFKKKVDTNSQIEIGDKKFRVVGIIDSGSQSSFASYDNVILISLDDGRELFASLVPKDQVSAMFVLVKEKFDVDAVGTKIEAKLRQSHKVKKGDEDFSVITPKFIKDQVGTIMNLLTLFLGAIAAVSLIVGGIGIANTMFMAVMERTTEIGILKAIGATDGLIVTLFLIESGILSFIGGAMGVALSLILNFLLGLLGVSTYLTPDLLFGALGFSFVIGLASGYFPAKNAAGINIITALRYE